MDKKDLLLQSIGDGIKSKSSLGASSTKKTNDTADVQNIDFDVIKASFINIEDSLNKINAIFEKVANSLQLMVEQNDQQKYLQEEQELEAKKQVAPVSQRVTAEKEKVADFFGNLKNFITSPAVLAGLAGIVYTILPKETQERIKTFFGKFAGGLSNATDGFSSLSGTVKGVGLALGLYFGGKMLSAIAGAIATTIRLIKSFRALGFGAKGLIVGGAVYGAMKLKDIASDINKSSETSEKIPSVETEESISREYVQEEKKESPVLDEKNNPIAVAESKPEVNPSNVPAPTAPPAQQINKPEPGSRAERMQVALGNIPTPQTQTSPEAKPAATPVPQVLSTVPESKPSVASRGTSTAITMPSETVRTAIESAAKRVGVDKSIMLAMAKQESGFNPDAKASSSSAKGLFQFISSTWNNMVKKYSASYPELQRGPTDLTASSIAGALYIKENAEYLRSNNIPVNGTTLYTSHFLGPGGAKTLLSAHPSALAANLLPGPAAANKNIFFDNGVARSVSQVIELLYKKVGRVAEHYSALDKAPSVAVPSESPKSTKGTQIASLSTKNEAMVSTKTMAPVVQNINNNSTSQLGNKSYDNPMDIPTPIANRGSLYATSTHSTQYA